MLRTCVRPLIVVVARAWPEFHAFIICLCRREKIAKLLIGMKQLHHKDGRAYTKADYEALAKKRAEQRVFLWLSVIDFLVIFLICAFSRYLYFFVFFGFQNTAYLSFSFYTAVVDAVLIFALFRLTMRYLRSVLLFFTGMVFLPIAVFFWQKFDVITQGKTIVKSGKIYYENGLPTINGLIYDYTLYPYFAFIVIALITFVFDPFKEKAIKDMR